MQLRERSKHELVAMMFNMAKQDGNLHDNELKFIYDLAEQMGLDASEVAVIYEQIDSFDLHPPKSEHERMAMLYQLLFLMKIDNSIDAAEKAYIRQVALRLGIRHTLTDKLIDLMQKHLTGRVPPGEMLEHIRAYLN